MHSRTDNINLHLMMMQIKLLMTSELLRSRYQGNLETSMTGRDFISDTVQLIYCKFRKIIFKRYGSYIDSPDWIKEQKATINPKYTDDKCF